MPHLGVLGQVASGQPITMPGALGVIVDQNEYDTLKSENKALYQCIVRLQAQLQEMKQERAKLLLLLAESEELKQDFIRANTFLLELRSDDLSILERIPNNYIKAGQKDKAVEIYTKLHRINQEHAGANLFFVRHYHDTHTEFENCLKHYRLLCAEDRASVATIFDDTRTELLKQYTTSLQTYTDSINSTNTPFTFNVAYKFHKDLEELKSKMDNLRDAMAPEKYKSLETTYSALNMLIEKVVPEKHMNISLVEFKTLVATHVTVHLRSNYFFSPFTRSAQRKAKRIDDIMSQLGSESSIININEMLSKATDHGALKDALQYSRYWGYNGKHVTSYRNFIKALNQHALTLGAKIDQCTTLTSPSYSL